MKKLLFLSLTALSIMGSAQILVTESFENATYPGFTITGGNTNTAGTYTGTSACDGSGFIGAQVYGSSTATRTVNLLYTKPASITANGKKVDITFSYSTSAFNALSSIGGTLSVAYSTDGGTNYTPLGNTITLTNTAISCATFTETIPESVNINGNFMLRIQTLGTSGTSYNFYSFIDNVRIKQEVTAAPTCATISSPANAATDVSVRPQITWAAVAGAESYKVKIGTTPGSSNIYTGTTFNTFFTPVSSNVFPPNTTLYTTVTPSNTLGDATGCPEISFTTGTNPLAPYCGPLTAKIGIYAISNIQFSNVTNPSTSTTVPHENFTDKIATVNRGTTYPITLEGAGVGTNNRFGFTVFIDWNQNGNFTDTGEAYFVTSDFAGGAAASGSTITVNKNIAVPATAALGNTRMRVKYQFNSSTTTVRAELSNPCNDVSQGQVEDYTIKVEELLSTSETNMNKKADITAYPNPFKDILKISDTKGVKSIVVTDVSGRQVKTLKASNELNLSDLNAGLYLINLHMEDGSIKALKAIKK